MCKKENETKANMYSYYIGQAEAVVKSCTEINIQYMGLSLDANFSPDITVQDYNVNLVQLTPSGPMETYNSCIRLEAHQRN